MKLRLPLGLVASLAGVAAAWIAFDLLVWGYGEAPQQILKMLVSGTWGTPYGAAQVLYKATPLLFTGVAVDLAMRAGLFNIGAEGQVAVAGLAVGALGGLLSPALSPWLAIPTLTVVAMIAGALWAAPAAVLRARFGVHEVISTIMLNRIGDALVAFALAAGLSLNGTVRTPDLPTIARVPRLEVLIPSFRGSAASFAMALSILVALTVPLGFTRTRVLREVALVGMNPDACAAERMPVSRRLIQAMALSGGIAGLSATATVLGYKGYFESGLGAGAGFGGIAVAILGRGSAVGLIVAALLFGTLDQGGLAINAHVPMEVMQVLEGLIVVAVAFADARVRDSVRSSIPRTARADAEAT